MGFQEFLTAFQAVKKELARPERASAAERDACLAETARLFAAESAGFAALDRERALFSAAFHEEHVIGAGVRAFGRARARSPKGDGFPVGLIGIRVRGPFFFRLLCERLASALKAGNGAIFQVSSGQEKLGAAVLDLLSRAGWPADLVRAIPESAETTTLLLQHPGVRGVDLFDPSFQSSEAAGTGTFWDKKWRVHRGGKTTALVLADADLDGAAAGIARAAREGWGASSWNPSRVIVVEQVEKEFRPKLLTALEALADPVPSGLAAAADEWVEKLRREQARPVAPAPPIRVLENVSNCAEAHQIELGAPILFLMTVKYPHEMQKWVNNLPNPLGVQIWGSPEKASKLASKLETGRVWTNGWIERDASLGYGVRSSVFGPFGSDDLDGFYSESRILDGSASDSRH